jgi:hypothetical protein
MIQSRLENWKLTLSPHMDQLSLDWDAESWSAQYWVPLTPVRDAGARIRRLLGQLNTFAHANEVLSTTWRGTEFENLIRQLRRAGQDLYLALFDTEESEKRELIENHLRQSSDIALSVSFSKGLTLPVGFVFPSHVTDPPVVERRREAFNGFWVHDLQITLNAVGGSCNRLMETDDFKVLYAVDDDQFLDLLKTSNLQSEWDPLLKLDFGKADGWDRTSEMWREITAANDYDNLLFVLGHNDEEGLHLGSSTMSSLQFRDRFRRKPMCQGSTLLFMNGCSTVGEGPTSFLKVIGRPGFCGLIGAETEIANDFAIRYAGRLLKRLLLDDRPVSIGEAFHAMREQNDLFPRNLLYSCYAIHNFRVAVRSPPAQAA